jgi:hypothetical protein
LECVSGIVRYFDVETDIALASAKGVCSWLILDAKDNPATLTRRLWSSVLCNAPKVQIVVFACLTIVAALQKKESRSAA